MQFVIGERLGQVFFRSRLHRFHSAVDGRVAGDHDYFDIFKVLANVAHQIQAADLRHFQVGNEQIYRVLVKDLYGLCGSRRSEHAVSTCPEGPSKYIQRLRSVVYGEYDRFVPSHRLSQIGCDNHPREGM
jgi:hypothetical protein